MFPVPTQTHCTNFTKSQEACHWRTCGMRCIKANVLRTKTDAQCDKRATKLSWRSMFSSYRSYLHLLVGFGSVRFALCYRTIVLSCPVLCLSCPVHLSVTLVYCGQTIGWIKMKLGVQVGLGPSHIVLDGDPAPPPKGAQPPNFWPMSLVLESWKVESWKVANFNLPHLHVVPLLGVTPFEFCRCLWHHKTRVPGLWCGAVCMILHLVISVEHQLVTDKQTDRQTHDYGTYGASMASHSKKWNFTISFLQQIFKVDGTEGINVRWLHHQNFFCYAFKKTLKTMRYPQSAVRKWNSHVELQ